MGTDFFNRVARFGHTLKEGWHVWNEVNELKSDTLNTPFNSYLYFVCHCVKYFVVKLFLYWTVQYVLEMQHLFKYNVNYSLKNEMHD